MPRARGRTVVALLSTLGVLVSLWAAAMYRSYFIETWYLLRLRASEGNERIAIVGALGSVGSRRSVAALLALVAEEDPTPEAPRVTPVNPVTPEVVRALFAIASREQRGIVHELARGLGDPRWKVRWRAAQLSGIVGRGAREVVPQLARALRDENIYVNVAACRALTSLGECAVPALVPLLDDPDINVRAFAARALARMRP